MSIWKIIIPSAALSFAVSYVLDLSIVGGVFAGIAIGTTFGLIYIFSNDLI